jgi:phenylalanyl-tRNA synthetase beta chain
VPIPAIGFNWADDPRRDHVALLNPISEEQAVMRTTLVPGILEAAQRNISRQQNQPAPV